MAQGNKIKVIERSVQVKELLGISFDSSLYFEMACFHQKDYGHILGLSDSLLKKYSQMKNKREKLKHKSDDDRQNQLSFRKE